MNLSAELDAWSNRPELSSKHNTFIEIVEGVLNARLHERYLEAMVTYSIIPGAGQFALLDSAIELLGMRIGDKEIQFRSLDEVMDARASGGTIIACMAGRNVVLSALSPPQAEVRQKTKITTVVGGGTNWVLTNFPHVYLFGCLVELFDYLRDAEQTAHYKTRFEEAIGNVNSIMTNKSIQQFARARYVR